MKTKTINQVLIKKINEWISTLPEEFQGRVKTDVIVTGGCIASMLLREKVNDYDLYFNNKRIVYDLAWHYVRQFKKSRTEKTDIDVIDSHDRVKIVIKSAGIASENSDSGYQYFETRPPSEAGTYVNEVFDGDTGQIENKYEETETEALKDEDKDYRPVFLSTNAITLSSKIQLILRFFGKPEQIHENYDFAHCTNFWTFKTGVVLHKDALEALITKELKYIGSKYPICSIIRIRKFINRGWTINAGQILKICFQISELDLYDIKVLEDQLTGVDVAYFMEVISLLKKKDGGKVDRSYLLEIIDRMF